jgi:hypothetical protein
VSAFEAAFFAYKFLLRQFGLAARLLLLPMTAAGLVLYTSLKIYLSQLVLFLHSPDPRVASFALGVLACGLFVSLFCYAVAVVAITNLALGNSPGAAWVRFRTERRDWRVYAAYLRFLLLLALMFVAVYAVSAAVTLFAATARNWIYWVLTIGSVLAIWWLTARIGFLIAPVVASSEGPVLRRAWLQSAPDAWRNCILIALLLIPGLLVQAAGEYAFRFHELTPRLNGNLPLADYAVVIRDMLGSIIFVISLSSFVTVVLLTAGAVAAYRGAGSQADATRQRRDPASRRGSAVRAEEFPE